MGAPPNNNFNPSGRPKGSVSEKTRLARDAIAKFVDGNAERLTGWLDEIAVENPKGAFDAFMSVVEYHIPKLARAEHVGVEDEPLHLKLTAGAELADILTIEQLEKIRQNVLAKSNSG